MLRKALLQVWYVLLLGFYAVLGGGEGEGEGEGGLSTVELTGWDGMDSCVHRRRN